MSKHRDNSQKSWAMHLSTVLMLLLLLMHTQAHAQPRHALVIGNAQYINESELVNTLNDARDIANVLSDQLGFNVTKLENANHKQLRRAVNAFLRDVKDQNGVALIYYSGHGMQDSRGKNYLLPVDAEIKDAIDIPNEGLALSDLLTGLEEREDAVNLVILDACRNNPFKTAAKSIGSKGLGRLQAPPSGTLILYATKPNKVASDNPTGRNGLFTKHLLNVINVPGIEVEQAFKRLSREVYRESKKQQHPWSEGAILGTFAFVRQTSIASEEPPATKLEVTNPNDSPITGNAAFELSFWESIKDSNDPDLFKAYLKKYPAGEFAYIANKRLTELTKPHMDKTTMEQIQKAEAAYKEYAMPATDEEKDAVEEENPDDPFARYRLLPRQVNGLNDACYWFTKAASSGNQDAQYEFAKFIKQSNYIKNKKYKKIKCRFSERDEIYYLKLASEQGHKESNKRLKTLCDEGFSNACL